MVLVAIFVLIPLVVALVEIVGLALLAVAVLTSRVLLRRPWVIEAATGDESRYEWRVVGGEPAKPPWQGWHVICRPASILLRSILAKRTESVIALALTARDPAAMMKT
ncbi:MAG TPA: hypothetical protein VMZ51_09000 [Acidimicrobiales bacterium]|nr:hypothetical protein [Acidimicrobiales bacterium]